MPREQGESGEFVETTAPEDALDVFDAVDGPVILSADVADHFGVTRETARRKLRQLHDRGVLDRRKISRRVIYWRASEEGFDAGNLRGDPSTTLRDTDPEDTARAAGGTEATETTAEDRDAESGRTRDESDAVELHAEDVIDAVLGRWTPETDAVDENTARAQTRRAVDWLRESDAAHGRRAFVDALADGTTLDAATWWTHAVRPGLDRFAALEIVEHDADGTYRWVGDATDAKREQGGA